MEIDLAISAVSPGDKLYGFHLFRNMALYTFSDPALRLMTILKGFFTPL